MALPQEKRGTMTEAEYLAFERASDGKHEYADGDVLAMSGASWAHGQIIMAVSGSLFNQLGDTPCSVITNDLRVKVAPANSYRYPDIVVVCGEPQFTDERVDTLLNPTVLIEVLSPSTALIDREIKLREYRQIPTLQAYVLISQHHPYLEQYQRQPDSTWLYTDAFGLESTLAVPTLNCTLALSDVYRKVTFEEAEADEDATPGD